MSLALIVYLINVIPGIAVMSVFVGVFCLIAGLLTIPWMLGIMDGYADIQSKECAEELKKPKSLMKKLVGFSLGLFLIAVLVPSENTMYTMLAAYGVERVATNEKTQEILGNGVDILNLQLQKYKDELLKEKSK